MSAPRRPAWSGWLWELGPGPAEPGATLVLLPHSGGLAQGFSDWARWFPAGVRLLAAQYPGRGPRYGESPARHIAALADPLADVLAGLPGPVHVFGHSLGGLLGFEVCWRLQQRGRAAAALYASSAAAPHVHRPAADTDRELTDEELLAVLRERGGMPAELFEHPDLLELVVESCRSDVEITQTYRYGPHRRVLDCPVLAFGGDADTAVPPAVLHRWPDLTTGGAAVHVLAGGHFYLHQQMAFVTGAVRAQLAAISGTYPQIRSGT